jgi:hypothetical protein
VFVGDPWRAAAVRWTARGVAAGVTVLVGLLATAVMADLLTAPGDLAPAPPPAAATAPPAAAPPDAR